MLPREDHTDTDHPRYEERLASVGYAQSVVDVKVVDGDDNEMPAGEVGEILAKGAVVMRGYWNRPDASAETLRGGWLHTGDMGAFDADGYLTLKDRSKDMIISGGTNIYPREIEEISQHHLPQIAVAEHRPFRIARRTRGVEQPGQIIVALLDHVDGVTVTEPVIFGLPDNDDARLTSGDFQALRGLFCQIRRDKHGPGPGVIENVGEFLLVQLVVNCLLYTSDAADE